MRKLALVTGASGGLDHEFAKLLAADGYDLALVARSGDALNRIASDLRVKHNVTWNRSSKTSPSLELPPRCSRVSRIATS